MIKTVGRVSKRARVSRTVVYLGTVLTSKATLTFAFIASISTGTGAIGTTRGGATVVMHLIASQAFGVGGRTVQSIGLGMRAKNTNLSFSAFSKAWIDNVFTVIASAIVRAVALIVVSTKGRATSAIAVTRTGLTHIKLLCTVNSSFI